MSHTFESIINRPNRKSIIAVASRLSDPDLKKQVYEWLIENHYRPKMVGNLSARVKNYNSDSCYEYIMRHCFTTRMPTTVVSMNTQITESVKKLHSIDPSLTGTFIDYLIRILLSEKMGIEFNDHRANSIKSVTRNYSRCKSGVYTLADVLFTSLAHPLSFSPTVDMNKVDLMLRQLFDFDVESLREFVYSLGTRIITNPIIHNKYNIPADADLIVDDVLYDIKCTNGKNDTYELLQVLAYASLMEVKPSAVGIINCLTGEVKLVNISMVTKEEFDNYARLLVRPGKE